MNKTSWYLEEVSPDSRSVFGQGHNARLQCQTRSPKLQGSRESTGVYYILCEIIISNRLLRPPLKHSNLYVYLAIVTQGSLFVKTKKKN